MLLDIILNINEYHPHKSIIKKIATNGPIMNMIIFMGWGFINSFVKTFTASAIGCVKPNSKTLLGPFR